MKSLLARGLAAAALVACGGDEFATGDSTTTSSETTTTTTTTGSDGGGGSTTTSSGGGGAGTGCEGDDVCVPPVPASWTGPLVLHVGVDGAPPCGPGFMGPMKTHAGAVTGAAAECTACTCDPPTGGTCAAPQIELFDTAGCNNGASYSGAVPGNPSTCTDISPDNMMSGVVVDVPKPAGDACASAGGGLAQPLSEPTWEAEVALCAPQSSSGSCAGDGTCAPPPPQGYANYCITKPTDTACPPGFANKVVYFHDVADSRDCSACSCGAPASTSCTVNVQMYTVNVGCQVVQLNATLKQGQCTDATTAWNGVAWSAAPTGEGSCSPGGGEPIGDVTATNPQTVCCVDPIPIN